MHITKQAFAVLALLTANLSFLDGQTATGKITGTVTDASGAVIPNASVKVTNIATNAGQDVTTNKDGIYRVFALPTGTLQVAIQLH